MKPNSWTVELAEPPFGWIKQWEVRTTPTPGVFQILGYGLNLCLDCRIVRAASGKDLILRAYKAVLKSIEDSEEISDFSEKGTTHAP